MAKPGALPNLIVVGAQKCGTSALHYYLDLHPDIQMSSPKELNFFCDELVPLHPETDWEPLERLLMTDREREVTWRGGIDWYRSQFDPATKVRGEASPNYTAPWYPRAAAAMAEVIPEARLIFCVRDPLEQIVSSFMHYRAAGNEPRSLSEAIADPEGMYVERARYHARLKPFADRFGIDRILVVEQQALSGRRRETMRDVFAFAGVDEFWSERMERERHATAAKNRRTRLLRRLQFSPALKRLVPLIPQEVKWRLERASVAGSRVGERPTLGDADHRRLAELLADDVAALRELTGVAFEGWSV